LFRNLSSRVTNSLLLTYAFLGIFLAIYSFVFVFDTKAGVGLAVILTGFWALSGFVMLSKQIFSMRNQNGRLEMYLKLSILLLSGVLVIGFLSFKYVKNNPGWESLLEDISISAQTDKYPDWQNLSEFGLPVRDDGLPINSSVYARVSWG
jgi:hypothetical protein